MNKPDPKPKPPSEEPLVCARCGKLIVPPEVPVWIHNLGPMHARTCWRKGFGNERGAQEHAEENL